MLEGGNYKITRKNLLAHELIGLRAVIKKSPDPNKIGIRGKIIDETKNMVMLETKNGVKKMAKKEVWLEIKLGREAILVDGNLLVARPEDRTKLSWRKNYARVQ